MVKLAHDKDGQRRERFVVSFGRQIRCNRHLADVEFERAAHAAESADNRRNLDMLELDAGHRHGAIFQAFRMRVVRERGLENGHVILRRAFLIESAERSKIVSCVGGFLTPVTRLAVNCNEHEHGMSCGLIGR